jgi:hypothetical protein
MSRANYDATAAGTATPAAPGDDAELLHVCAEFHRLYAATEALPRKAGESLVIAALARRRNATDRIALITATTDAGRRAKAAVASVLLDEWGTHETSRTVIFARAVLRDIGGVVAERTEAMSTNPIADDFPTIAAKIPTVTGRKRAKRSTPLPTNVIPIRPRTGRQECVRTGPCDAPAAPGRFVQVFAELTEQWAARRAPRRSAVVLPFSAERE